MTGSLPAMETIMTCRPFRLRTLLPLAFAALALAGCAVYVPASGYDRPYYYGGGYYGPAYGYGPPHAHWHDWR